MYRDLMISAFDALGWVVVPVGHFGVGFVDIDGLVGLEGFEHV